MTAITILKQLDLISPLLPPQPPTSVCWGGWLTLSFTAFTSASFSRYCRHLLTNLASAGFSVARTTLPDPAR